MDWNHLSIFLTVSQAGSFTAAAKRLNVNQSSVSRQIQSLEKELGCVLFRRGGRGLDLTEAGITLYKTVDEINDKILRVRTSVLESKNKIQGPIRVLTSPAFASGWLSRNLKYFLRAYPKIDVDISAYDGMVDGQMKQVDCAIRFAPSQNPDVIQKLIFEDENLICASQEYLQQNGMPIKLDDLVQHQLISYGHKELKLFKDMNWLLFVGRDANDPRPGRIFLNSTYGIYKAVKAGLGIGMVPSYLIQKDDDIVPISMEENCPNINIYFSYHKELRGSKRILAFRDFLTERLKLNAKG